MQKPTLNELFYQSFIECFYPISLKTLEKS